MPRIQFIIHFLLEILHFKEPCNLIGWQHFGLKLENQNFARYGIGGEISRILVFIIDYFQEKLMTNFFRRSKKTYCGVILGPFCPNLLKNKFSWKNGLSVFKYFNQLPSCQNHKKLMRHCWEKYWTDGRTENRQTVQKWFYRILRKTGVQKFGSYSKKQ